MTHLVLVRHGETEWNRVGRVQGSTDIPLNDTGRHQAQHAARELASLIEITPETVIISSDLVRAHETAQIIAAELGVDDVRTDPDLRERAYGEAEGTSAAEFLSRWGAWHTAEVPGAESREDVRDRALRAIQRATTDLRLRTAPSAASLVMVAHGALIRELIRHASGGELPLEGERLANASLTHFLVERERMTVLSYPVAAA